jgi:transcriptional regulator
MYIPPAFQQTDKSELLRLIREYPLGLLVTCGPGGLQTYPLPFCLAADAGENGILRAHIAKGNACWRELKEIDDCLVVFRGPDSYIAPEWYPSKKITHRVVPTWNYTLVQAWGTPKIIDSDTGWLRRQVAEFSHIEERKRVHPWTPDDVPEEYMEAMLNAIVGLEISLRKIEGKWKLSQNKDAADRQGIVDGLRDAGDPHYNPASSMLVEKYGK